MGAHAAVTSLASGYTCLDSQPMHSCTPSPVLCWLPLHFNILYYKTGAFKKRTNSVAFIPRTNYTDWATVTCRRNLVLTFADRGVSRGQRGGTRTAVNLSFLDRSRYFLFQVAPHLSAQWLSGPFPDPLLLGKSGNAGNRNLDLWVSSQEL
jgi:hypothetical protein